MKDFFLSLPGIWIVLVLEVMLFIALRDHVTDFSLVYLFPLIIGTVIVLGIASAKHKRQKELAKEKEETKKEKEFYDENEKNRKDAIRFISNLLNCENHVILEQKQFEQTESVLSWLTSRDYISVKPIHGGSWIVYICPKNYRKLKEKDVIDIFQKMWASYSDFDKYFENVSKVLFKKN